MSQNLAELWPPPYPCEDRILFHESDIIRETRSAILSRLHIGKKYDRIRGAKKPEIVFSLEKTIKTRQPLELTMGMAHKRNGKPYFISDSDLPELINTKLCPEARFEIAKNVFWQFAEDEQYQRETAEYFAYMDSIESHGGTEEEFWDQRESGDDETYENDEDDDDFWNDGRKDMLPLLNSLDEQFKLRQIYCSIILGRYGED